MRRTKTAARNGEEKRQDRHSFGKRNVLGSLLSEYREGFCRRGSRRSSHVDGPKTEKAREPTVELGARNLEAGNINEKQKGKITKETL